MTNVTVDFKNTCDQDNIAADDAPAANICPTWYIT